MPAGLRFVSEEVLGTSQFRVPDESTGNRDDAFNERLRNLIFLGILVFVVLLALIAVAWHRYAPYVREISKDASPEHYLTPVARGLEQKLK